MREYKWRGRCASDGSCDSMLILVSETKTNQREPPSECGWSSSVGILALAELSTNKHLRSSRVQGFIALSLRQRGWVVNT